MTGREGHPGVWWTVGRYEGWEEAEEGLEDWVQRTDDLPDPVLLLTVTDPRDGTHWLNCDSSVVWRQKPPVGRRLADTLRGELTYWVAAHLIREEDAPAVKEAAPGGSLLRASAIAESYADQVFMGEHAWSPASKYVGAEWRVSRRLRLTESRAVWIRPGFRTVHTRGAWCAPLSTVVSCDSRAKRSWNVDDCDGAPEEPIS